ncbi:cyclin-like protein [Chlamydoabsidia padenii]|nr:cyclin-like protein [Chlamydoabsidia padenii]
MLYGSELQRALGKNSKTSGVVEDENTTNNAANLVKGQTVSNTGDIRKHPLQSTINANKTTVLGESKRYSLNDKSNRFNQLPSISTSTITANMDKENCVPMDKQRHTILPEQDQHKRPLSTATEDKPTLTEKQQQNDLDTKSTSLAQDQTAAEAAAKADQLQAFFDDNKRRYKSNASDTKSKSAMKPTPVLPIIVPDRMKTILREKYLSSSKRSYENMYKRGEHLLATLKRQKSHNHGPSAQGNVKSLLTQQQPSKVSTTTTTSSSSSSSHYNKKSKTPTFESIESAKHEKTDLPVDQETYNEAKKLEQDQEQRAQQNLLKDNQTHHKSRYRDGYDDDDYSNDPMLVAEYAEDIFAYLRATEEDTMVDPSYITIQHEVTWRMRDVLIDWVTEVHYMFHLLPETLFLTVNIIDRFLAKRDVSISKLQLVAIASLFVATKFEETVTPPLKQFIYMTGDAVTEEDLLKSERYILQILDFKLCYPNPLHFLRKSTMTRDFDIHVRLLAKYFMEITFIDHRFLGTPPSLVAASALWLSLKMLCKGTWTPELIEASGYGVNEIKPVVELILDYLSQPGDDGSFFKKWSSKRMMKVSIFVRDWVQRFYG